MFGAATIQKRERYHLFLIRRKAAWPRACDSIINSCCSPNDTDCTVFETEYEELVTMPDGTQVTTVKIAEDFADMVAAKGRRMQRRRKKKTATAKNNDPVFDITPVARETSVVDGTDAKTAPRLSLGHLNRKRGSLRRGVRGRQFTFDS